MKRLIKKVTFYKENKKITHVELHINENCVLFFVKSTGRNVRALVFLIHSNPSKNPYYFYIIALGAKSKMVLIL